MNREKPAISSATSTGHRFDYIIVGGGSAGATLASRLSESSELTVCLIEAGPQDKSPLIRIPLGVMLLAKDKRHNWLYSSSPQVALDGREVSIPRGKVLGGSSAINGMIYIRGHRSDYDTWAALGCTGWDYESVLPYFRASEANQDPSMDEAYHGRSGPLNVTYVRDPSPIDQDFVEAAGRLQLRPCADFNSPEPEGVGVYQVTQKNGKRHSTAEAYLKPARKRPNLHIITGLEVESLDIDQGRACAVIGRRPDGSRQRLDAAGEIVLSAGAIGSPDILLRSGIGPGADLQAANISPTLDLPGVGQNLQDHVDVMVIARSRSTTPYGFSLQALPSRALDLVNWVTRKRGMFGSNMVEAGGFVRSSPIEERPDIQFHIIPGLKSHRGRMIEYGHGVSLHTCILRPESRGSLRRTSATGRPEIDLGLLNHEADMERMLRGVKLAREILRQQPMARHGLSEVIPGADLQNDDELRRYIRQEARTVYHPVGTCAMGLDRHAVVDPQLRVHGLQGLRVVDASIMPRIVSGNTNAPAIMIAEKAADMIRADRRKAAA